MADTSPSFEVIYGVVKKHSEELGIVDDVAIKCLEAAIYLQFPEDETEELHSKLANIISGRQTITSKPVKRLPDAFRFTAIEFRNFKAFKKADISFPGKPDDGHMIFFNGENGQGKSSIVQGLQWCLYGECYGKSNIRIDDSKIPNHGAASEGEKEVSVTLYLLNEDDQEIKIERIWVFESRMGGPGEPSKKQNNVHVSIAGEHLTKIDSKRYIDSVFPKSLSKFFIFDGERLDSIVDSLNGSGDTIRDDIYKMLGTPILDDVIFGIQRYRSATLDPQINKYSKGNKEVQKLQKQIDSFTKVVAQGEENNKALQSSLDGYQEQSKLAESQLEGFSHRIQEQTQLTEYRKHIENSIGYIDATKHQFIESIPQLWKSIVHPEVDKVVNKWFADAKVAQARLVLESEIKKIESSTSTCQLCKQPIDDSQRLKMLESKKDELSKMGDIAPALAGTVVQEYNNLDGQDAWKNLFKAKKDLHRHYSEIVRYERKIEKEHLTGLTQSDHDQYISLKKNNDEIHKAIGKCNFKISHELAENTRNREDLKKRTYRRDKLIRDDPNSDDKLSDLQAQSDVAYNIEQCMNLSRDELADTLRLSIENKTNEFFQDLSTSNEYGKIAIDDRFRLTISWSDENLDPELSAGYLNLLAYSFVLALNEVSCRNKPFFMDTPFGRLDNNHRKSVLRLLAKKQFQVSIFVHLGETDANVVEDLATAYEKLVVEATYANYNITRDEDSHESFVTLL
jgi:DNA sulfur modification protein DndD